MRACVSEYTAKESQTPRGRLFLQMLLRRRTCPPWSSTSHTSSSSPPGFSGLGRLRHGTVSGASSVSTVATGERFKGVVGEEVANRPLLPVQGGRGKSGTESSAGLSASEPATKMAWRALVERPMLL